MYIERLVITHIKYSATGEEVKQYRIPLFINISVFVSKMEFNRELYFKSHYIMKLFIFSLSNLMTVTMYYCFKFHFIEECVKPKYYKDWNLTLRIVL